MTRGRLEAFSDGVIAVLITIMVLELRPPEGHELSDLRPLLPKVTVYVLSFVFLAIYWNNHHHLMQVVERITGGALWANALLLLWLSFIPVSTDWLGNELGEVGPTVVYGVVMVGAALAFSALTLVLLRSHPADSALAIALGADWKGKLSLAAYLAAVGCAFVVPWLAMAIYVGVALVWLVPDTRIERVIAGNTAPTD